MDAKRRPITSSSPPPASPAADCKNTQRHRFVRPLIGIGIFALAAWALYASLRDNSLRDIGAAMRALPPLSLAQSVLLTVLSYLILTLYDQLGFRAIAHRLPWRRIALASFIGNVFGNSGANATLTGAAVRYWIYTSFGVPAFDVARVVVFCNVGFWLGYFTLGAAIFWYDPLPAPALLATVLPGTRPLGVLLTAVLAGYLVLVALRRPLRFRRWHFALPTPGMTGAQIAVAVCDLLVMASTLWVLLPATPELSFLHFVQVFLLALVAGGVSQVPGGLGVFEGVFLLLLPGAGASSHAAAALLAFRAIYYLAPLGVAAVLACRRAGAAVSLSRFFRGR